MEIEDVFAARSGVAPYDVEAFGRIAFGIFHTKRDDLTEWLAAVEEGEQEDVCGNGVNAVAGRRRLGELEYLFKVLRLHATIPPYFADGDNQLFEVFEGEVAVEEPLFDGSGVEAGDDVEVMEGGLIAEPAHVEGGKPVGEHRPVGREDVAVGRESAPACEGVAVRPPGSLFQSVGP